MISSQALAVFDMDPARTNVVLTIDGCDLNLGPRERLTSARANVSHHLTRFRSQLSRPIPKLADLSQAIRQLDYHMGQLALQLVNDNTALLDEVRRRLVDAWPQWQQSNEIIPLIEVRGHDGDFPFELLPLLDSTEVTEFVNYAEAENALHRFLAFGAVIRRTTGETAVVDNLRADPLPVQLLSYEIPDTGSGFESLEPHDGIEVEGPWPDPESALEPATFMKLLVDALYDPTKALDGGTRTRPVQIQHFACHGDTTDKTDSDFTLLLGGPHERERRISLGAIRHGFRQREARLVPPSDARPLVIANACGSAVIDKASHRSFHQFFLNNRYRGFIGTEADVPTGVAVAFSVRFYEALLEGRPIGEAVVRARQRLFTERGNPLGLLYVLYGDPFLGIG
ncbi:CHAT domain-containing protein [Streptomyces sp. NPDC056944]|uniref:CHAT domain-containing protein n=1 Tax=Streptomyces sp. NPDC056944 TaxID=3345972 RepID=UPI0036320998